MAPIWDWISRDLESAGVKVLAADVDRALLAGDRATAERSTAALHEHALPFIEEAVDAAASVTSAQLPRRRSHCSRICAVM